MMKHTLKQVLTKVVFPFHKFSEQNNQRKFIINCGGHKAKYLKDLRRQFDPNNEFFIHTFEPYPAYAEGYKGIKRHELHQRAVWIYDGLIKFYVQDSEKSQGHSLCEKKTNINPERFIEVECIDFGAWIKRTFNKDDYIIVRMDIEGAEFVVLDNIIKDGSIEYVNKLLVEFHHRKHPAIASEADYQNLLSRITIPFEEIPH